MKKKLLFLLASAFVAIGASAREDVTNKLTDAALANETANWALVSNGGNHNGPNNGYHESWHNTFSLTQTVKDLPAGYYTLSIQIAVENNFSSAISLTATAGSKTSVAAHPVYTTAGSYGDMAAWWKADADALGNADLNRIFTTVKVEEGEDLVCKFEQTANNQWMVYGQFKLESLTEAEGKAAMKFEAAYNTQAILHNMADGRFKQRFESYDAAAIESGERLVYTYTGLPAGKYNVTLNGSASYTSGRGFAGNTGDNLTVFFANDQTVNVPVLDRGNVGNSEFGDYTVEGVNVTDGTLKVGYRNLALGANWFTGSIKRIEFLGADLSELVTAFEATLAAAKAFDQNQKMNAEVKAALNQAITENDVPSSSFTEVEEIEAAIKALGDAKTAAEASVAHYAAAKAALDAQKALMDGTNIYNAEGFAAYQTAWTTNNTKYENNTLTNEDAVVNPTVATGWHASTAYNFLLTPWTIGGEACNEFDKALYINTWSTEGNTDGTNFTTPFFEYWVADGESLGNNTLATTVTGLENGLYSATAWVRVRAKNGVTATEATGINLVVGDGAYAGSEGNGTVDATEGAQVGTSQFTLAEVTAYALVKDGNFNIKFEVKDANISWLSFKNVKYAKVRDLTEEEKMVPATPEQIAAFNAAIEAAEAKTVGFQEGEYAPYTNVAAIATLKAAKAINTEDPIAQETVVNATTALTNATWTPNTEEMNAVYDGTFANAENNGAPAGWTMSNNTLGGALHSRAFVGDERLNEFNETCSGFFLRFDGNNSNRGSMYYYGRTEGYEMPLKANTKYYVSVDFAGWGSTGKPLRLNVTGPEGFTTVYKQANTSVKADTESKDPQNHYIEFTTGPAGNYQINFQTPGADTNTHNVIVSNIVLKSIKEVSADMTISSVGTATFCAPFDVEIPEGVTAYEAEIADNSWVKLKEIESGVIEAGTPVVLKGDAMQKTFTDVPTVTVTKSSCLVGNLGTEKVEVVANAGNYLLQKNDGVLAWYQVKDAGLYIGVNRCYLEFSGDNAREFFPMDFDNPTGIDSIVTEAKTKADGKYLVNGKIVVVKAGKVYELK